MKKSLMLLLTATYLFNCHNVNAVVAPVEFKKLAPTIIKNAQQWAEIVVNTLSAEAQLLYLNFFALNKEDSIQGCIKCIKHIETVPEMLPTFKAIGATTITMLNKYIEAVKEKITRKKNLSVEQENSLLEKLEQKIQDLYLYINAIYYQALYGAVAEKQSVTLVYIFDNNGMLPQDQQTQALPQPE
jgi:hypothetical protein